MAFASAIGLGARLDAAIADAAEQLGRDAGAPNSTSRSLLSRRPTDPRSSACRSSCGLTSATRCSSAATQAG
jgi:hypothetical protein